MNILKKVSNSSLKKYFYLWIALGIAILILFLLIAIAIQSYFPNIGGSVLEALGR